MPDKHAILAPSAAHRWLVCTPCAQLEATLPQETSEYAREGTLAHSLCEHKLRIWLDHEAAYTAYSTTGVPGEMNEMTDRYADYVIEELIAQRANTPDAKLLVEVPLDFTGYVPDSFGTSDVVIVSDDTLIVIDFKYGKGVRVDAEGNPQLRLYALGAYLALNEIYDFTKVRTVVFQPRLDHIDSEDLTVESLLLWAREVVKPRAEMASKGEGPYQPGEHCRFCRAAAVCRARAEEAFKVVDKASELPPTLADEEIAAVLGKLDATEAWIKSIREYALDKAVKEGKHWPGYKLVEARTLRKIGDQVAALDRLEQAGYDKDDVTNVKLKGLTELPRLLG